MLVVVVRKSSLSWPRLLDLALIYIAATCFAISYGEQFRPDRGGISIVAVLILLIPLFVPTTLPRTVATAFVAASMPLLSAMVYRHTHAEVVESPGNAWVSIGFNFFVAALSTR